MKSLSAKLVALLEGEGEALLRAAIEKGRSGDVSALRLAIDRLMPPLRERPIKVDLPSVDSVGDVPRAIGFVVASVARGDLVPSEGTAIVGMLSSMRSAFELVDLQARLEAVERALPMGPAASGMGGV
jgi:hypothetical protein